MWYLASFLGGALGFAMFDKATENSKQNLNIVKLGLEMALIYWLIKKIK